MGGGVVPNASPFLKTSRDTDSGKAQAVVLESKPLKIQYNEITLAAGDLQEILGKIVPINKVVTIRRLWVESDNLSRFDIKINGVVKVSKKNYYTKFDRDIDLEELTLQAGDVFKVEGQNFGNVPAQFRTSLLFNEESI